ncbi:MAG: hypothetical protein MJY69_06275 [Bacteroidales bacterium]|nr:hypothetical protein [Bacteroidales bacterium]
MLRIAKILKSNGTDGGVLLGLRDVEIGQIDLEEPVFIEFDGLPVPFFIQSIAPKGTSKAVAHLNDVSSLEDAEEMVGRDVFIEGEWEEEDEEDFTGWTIYDRGHLIGTVTGIEDIPGNPCLYVQPENGEEILIPLHEDFILEADPSSLKLDLELPEGLF